MSKHLPVSLLFVVLSACASIEPRVEKSCYHANESVETGIGNCQAVRVDNTLYIAGTAGQGEMASAMHSVYDRLQKTLEANGLTFANVVKDNVYATDSGPRRSTGSTRRCADSGAPAGCCAPSPIPSFGYLL